MDVLLTFTGFHDPYFKGLVGQEEQPGPILSLLSARPFDVIFLFSTPSTEQVTKETKKAIMDSHANTKVEILGVNLDDPTDYTAILKGLRQHIHVIQETLDEAAFYIAVASGTPQMHACWVLLAAAGEIPARLLHVRPPHFVTKERPLVTEVDLTSREFPVVRSQIGTAIEVEDSIVDVDAAAAQLGIVGDHPAMRRALETGAMLAPSNSPILIFGETGTGKELFARFIHRLSGRQKENFVAINCAAIPEDLIESILFGHKKGAFTGATNDQLGKFDLADKGTLFLDELGDLPLAAQAKLLRVLQDGLVEPVGAGKPHRVDVRIVAATNRDLRKQVRQGKFREDLFYRLNVGEITLPPLRERRSDIPKLALHILDRVNDSLKRPKRLSPGALARLQAHSWPGNIRDLENVIERSARLSRHEVLEADDLLITEPVTYADPLDVLPEPYEGFSLEEFLNSARKQLILRALETSDGNQSKAARLLGITPQAVHKFLQRSKSDFNQG
ncbi:MAG: sigma-54-dependent Fis family transcriptional regulator [Deltaproteobacteria bacterium]|nr:MAG: sigma-54-dependent Fis family transcriptional regulator [Deltaproteobacteria bacterium]